MLRKKVAILGDSYSTYKGWIPEDYEAWYSDFGNSKPNDVNAVEQTWWYKLFEELGWELLRNCSYSGSTVCYTGYDGIIEKETSFLGRMKRELGPDLEEKPDLILVFSSTNDYWANSPRGREKYDNWREADFLEFAPSFCYMMNQLLKWNPNIPVIHIVNDDIGADMKTLIAKMCQHYQIPNIVLEQIDKDNGHPNQRGMKQIKEQIYASLKLPL